MSVGANIRKRRYELGLSQQELADALGYKTRSTIAKIESGENDVTESKLRRFARVLDTTVEALISGWVLPSPFPQAGARQDPEGGRTAAVLLAGGKSSRNQQNIPNQFLSVGGKPVIVYCLEAYQRHPAVDDIYVVCLKGWEHIVSAYAREHHITKLRGLIPGGPSGIRSVEGAVEALSEYGDGDVVIFQESTRPMVSGELISKLLGACYEQGSVSVCRSMGDNVQFLCREGRAEYLDREAVVDLQSPDAYRFSVIREVFRTARARNHPLTESCCTMLLYNLGYPIHFIEGGIHNIKIVRQEDLAVFTSLLHQAL